VLGVVVKAMTEWSSVERITEVRSAKVSEKMRLLASSVKR
jgi:hypothetical protein